MNSKIFCLYLLRPSHIMGNICVLHWHSLTMFLFHTYFYEHVFISTHTSMGLNVISLSKSDWNLLSLLSEILSNTCTTERYMTSTQCKYTLTAKWNYVKKLACKLTLYSKLQNWYFSDIKVPIKKLEFWYKIRLQCLQQSK